MQPLLLPPDDRIRALAAEILARNEYAVWRPANVKWWLDLLHQLQRWLAAYAAWMQVLSVTRPLLYWLVTAGLVIVPLLLLAHVVWTLRVALAGSRRVAALTPARAEEPQFLQEAEQLAGAGRFLDAAHRVQLAAIDVLLRRQVLQLSRSDPNRTLRRRLDHARLPDADRREFLTLLDRFEMHWFRDGHGDRDLYEAWRSLHARLCGLPDAA
jgi:hypothetical protein